MSEEERELDGNFSVEHRLRFYAGEVRGYTRAVSFFSKLSYVFWGAFFACAFNAYQLFDWIYLVCGSALLAVASYWWSHYLDSVLLFDAESNFKSAEYDAEYQAWGDIGDKRERSN